MNNNIGEIICEAVDTIVSKRLQGLNYNTTQTCSIINDSYKQIGRYTVKGDNLTFEAYSTDTTFKKGDNVLVMIPNGDYSEQKIILNKISTDDDLTSSVAYVSPLKKMIKFSSNIITNNIKIINDDTNNGVVSLLANGDNRVGDLNPEEISYKRMYTIDFSGYNNYGKLGISADFQSWLRDFDVVSGDYGLEFLFFDDNTSVADMSGRQSTYRFTFSVNDILGNPYNFQTYFTQEKLIDITHLKNLRTLEIYFYQNGNFKTGNGEYVINSINNEFLPDNLFVKNLELYVGYDVNEYSGDTITINTTDILTFSRLRDNDIKHINMYWVRKIDDNDYQIIDSTNTAEGSNIALTHDGTDINLIDAEVYWVRQDALESDLGNMDIVGANWIYRDSEIAVDNVNKFACTLNINSSNNLITRENIKIKAVLRIREDENWKIYESSVLTFTSEDELADQTTVDAITGLSIQCNDGGYSGIYFIYGSNNRIIDESKGSGHTKQLILYYSGKEIGSNDAQIQLDDIVSISWTVWKDASTGISSSMLRFPSIPALAENETPGLRIYNPESPSSRLNYTISDTWYPSITQNSVSCTVQMRDGTEYKASKELLFGKANSQGSNYNLVISYQELNQNAYEVITNNSNVLENNPASTTMVAKLYDTNGEVDTSIASDWSWTILNGAKEGENGIFSVSHSNSPTCDINLINRNSDILIHNYTILKVSCTISDKTISAYKPIAIKTKVNNNTARCNAISGDPVIVYNSFGSPSYYNSNSYFLTDASGVEVEDIEWSINYGADESGLPQLVGRALSASSVYINDNKYQICVSAAKDDVIYWSQPIFVTRSNYDLAIDNNWESETDISGQNTGETTTVRTSAVAAGSVTSEGFTGMILGEVSIDGDTRTGLYGLSSGAVTFSLTNSGQATFQNSSGNTLSLFGTENYIVSCDQAGHNIDNPSSNNHTCANLLLTDFDDRKFIFSNTGDESKSGIYMSAFGTAGNPYMYFTTAVSSTASTRLMNFTSDSLYLRSADYSSSSTSKSGLHFDVKNGKIEVLRNGSTLTIGKHDNNNNIFNVFSNSSTSTFAISNSGSILYQGEDLEEYINKKIEKAIEDHVKEEH